jgi:hypothetical protein
MCRSDVSISRSLIRAPPAAALVINGDIKSERELKLESDLAAEREARRKAEIIAAEKEDEATRLREIQSRPPSVPPVNPAPKKVKRARLFATVLGSSAEDDDE